VEKEANATVPILDENLQIVEAFLEALQLENNVEIVEVKKSVPTTLRTPYTIWKSLNINEVLQQCLHIEPAEKRDKQV